MPGSALVRVPGSALVRVPGSALVRVPGSALVRVPGSALVRVPGSALVRVPGSALVRVPGSALVRVPGSALVRVPGSAPVRVPVSAPVRVPISAAVRGSGSALVVPLFLVFALTADFRPSNRKGDAFAAMPVHFLRVYSVASPRRVCVSALSDYLLPHRPRPKVTGLAASGPFGLALADLNRVCTHSLLCSRSAGLDPRRTHRDGVEPRVRCVSFPRLQCDPDRMRQRLNSGDRSTRGKQETKSVTTKIARVCHHEDSPIRVGRAVIVLSRVCVACLFPLSPQ